LSSEKILQLIEIISTSDPLEYQGIWFSSMESKKAEIELQLLGKQVISHLLKELQTHPRVFVRRTFANILRKVVYDLVFLEYKVLSKGHQKLLRILRDEDDSVRSSIIEILFHLGDDSPKAIEQLLTLYDDKCDLVKIYLYMIFGTYNKEEVTPTVLENLYQKNARYAMKNAIAAYIDSPIERERKIDGLKKQILHNLRDSCYDSIIALSKINPSSEAIADFLLSLFSIDLKIINLRWVAYALGNMNINPEKVIPILKRGIMQYKDNDFRKAAIETLGKYSAKDSIGLLIEIINGLNPELRARDEVKYEAIKSLKLIGILTKDIQKTLVSQIKTDSRSTHAWYAAETLISLKAKSSFSFLKKKMHEKDDFQQNYRLQLKIATEFLKIGERDAQEVLQKIIREGSISAKCQAIRGLNSTKNQEILKALIKALEDLNPNVQQAAAQAIRKFGAEALPAVPALIKILDTPYAGFAANSTLVTIARTSGFASKDELIEKYS